MDISVIIVSYNTRDILSQCLKSLFEWSKDVDFEVIIIDNASRDDTVSWIENNMEKVKIIKNSINRGFARAVNQGAQLAKGQYILLLNPDVKLCSNVLKVLMKHLDATPSSAVVGAQLLGADGSSLFSCRRFMSLGMAIFDLFQLGLYFPENSLTRRYNYQDVINLSDIREVDWCSGAALMTRRKIFWMLKGLDEIYFMYAEDMDYCWRVRKAGLKVHFVGSARLIHAHGTGGSQFSDARKIDYYKSLFLYLRKVSGLVAAVVFRCLIVFWSVIYLLVRLLKVFIRLKRGNTKDYLVVPLRLMRLAGYEEKSCSH